MRRGRDGEPVDPDVEQQHHCRRGWIGEGLEIQPCRICKPHLFSHVPDGAGDEPPATADSIASARQHLRQTLGWE